MTNISINQSADVIRKIEEIITLVPSNWATILASRMGKKPATLRTYATGSRGKKVQHLQLLSHLLDLQHEQEIHISNLYLHIDNQLKKNKLTI